MHFYTLQNRIYNNKWTISWWHRIINIRILLLWPNMRMFSETAEDLCPFAGLPRAAFWVLRSDFYSSILKNLLLPVKIYQLIYLLLSMTLPKSTSSFYFLAFIYVRETGHWAKLNCAQNKGEWLILKVHFYKWSAHRSVQGVTYIQFDFWRCFPVFSAFWLHYYFMANMKTG